MNPWDAVDELRFQYEKRIGEELRAHEASLANRTSDDCKCAWKDTMQAKGVAYRAYVRAVDAAVKSGIPRPR